GIRDFHVTGVQTCALPICHDQIMRPQAQKVREAIDADIAPPPHATDHQRRDEKQQSCPQQLAEITFRVHPNTRVLSFTNLTPARSEERRVGKECSAERSEE